MSRESINKILEDAKDGIFQERILVMSSSEIEQLYKETGQRERCLGAKVVRSEMLK